MKLSKFTRRYTRLTVLLFALILSITFAGCEFELTNDISSSIEDVTIAVSDNSTIVSASDNSGIDSSGTSDEDISDISDEYVSDTSSQRPDKPNESSDAPDESSNPSNDSSDTSNDTSDDDSSSDDVSNDVSDDVAPIDKNGSYYSKDDVALYIHTYGTLPKNFITKSEANALGWKSGSVEKYAPGCAIGGDRFYNREGLLPSKSGRTYTECDIDTLGKSSRGAKRIVFSNDGLIYYTSNHYDSFTLLYGEE